MFKTLQKAIRKIVQIFYIDCNNKKLRIFIININKKQARDIFDLYLVYIFNSKIVKIWKISLRFEFYAKIIRAFEVYINFLSSIY